MASFSIALRLSLGLAIGTGLLWIGAASISATVMRHELNEAFDETLQQSAYRLLPLAIHDVRELQQDETHQVPGLDQPGDENYFTYFVRDRDGRVIVRGDNAPPELVAVTLQNGFSKIDGKRLFAATDANSGYGIVVLESSDHRDKALLESIAALAWPLLGLLPLIALAIWAAIRLAMRPVERLRRDIESRDGRNLAPLTVEGHPVELAPIAQAVASLIDRLRTAMDAERSFAASSAHELRTPIAGALAQTQQLALELGQAPGHERLGEIELALKSLGQLAEKLLQLSRLDAGFARADHTADLMPALGLVVRDFQARSTVGERLQLVVSDGATLRAPINVDAFAIAVTNLVQNALLHGAVDQPICVAIDQPNVLRVTNAGAVVPADILQKIGQPFQRGPTSSTGSGLGLSIVRSIMEQTGGTLVMRSPAAGQTDGFEAVIQLSPTPRSPA